MTELEITQEQLAETIGRSQGGVGHWLRGVREPSIDDINLMLTAVGLPQMCVPTQAVLETVFGHAALHQSNVAPIRQPHRKSQEYPLISWVAAGSWQESCDNFQPGDADTWLPSDINAGAHGYWLEVKGPSMLPLFTEGMRILVRPEGYDLVSGKFYIAKLMDTGETTFKQYIRDGGMGFLQPLNSAFPVLLITDNVQIIGQVVDGRLPPIF